MQPGEPLTAFALPALVPEQGAAAPVPGGVVQRRPAPERPAPTIRAFSAAAGQRQGAGVPAGGPVVATASHAPCPVVPTGGIVTGRPGDGAERIARLEDENRALVAMLGQVTPLVRPAAVAGSAQDPTEARLAELRGALQSERSAEGRYVLQGKIAALEERQQAAADVADNAVEARLCELRAELREADAEERYRLQGRIDLLEERQEALATI